MQEAKSKNKLCSYLESDIRIVVHPKHFRFISDGETVNVISVLR